VASGTPNQEGYNFLMGQLQLEQALSMFPDYAYEAVSQAQAADANNVSSNVQFTVDDYLRGIDVSDGISEDETNLAFNLLSTGTVTVADLAAKTGIPASAIQSTYDTMVAANAAQAQADFAAATAAADAEERRVTGMLYAEEQARLAFERSAAADARMKQNAADAEAAALAAEAAARQAAQAAANIQKAADTQAKDDDFDTKVNAAGGVTPGTIGEVIDIALEVYGDDSRGVVKVISESLKGGLTMKDLEDATDLSGNEILAAAKTAANDPNKSLTPGEILSGATNTVYDITNKVVDIVETGLEVTGIEKVIDTIGNTVSTIVGLDPNQTQKVLVVNPVTGQVTVQASNQPQGGILGSLPQSPYVPIGTTSGGTTYGIDAENAIINVVLGKIITNGGLDQGDTKSIIAASVEETTGIPMEVAANVIDVVGAVIDETGKLIDNSGILNAAENNTGTTLTIGGLGGTNVGDTSFENIMGPIDTRTDAEKAADAEEAANRTYTSVGSSTQDLLDLIANSGCPEGSGKSRNAEGICVCPGGMIDAGGGTCVPIDDDDGTDKIICPDTYNNAKAEVDSLDQCGGLKSTGGGGQTKVCKTGTRLAGQTVDINADCGTIGGQTKVCKTGTRLAGQTVDINADCGTIGGQTKVCETGTRLAGQTVDINTDCGTIGGQTKVCKTGTRLAGQTVDINADCGTIGGQTKVCKTGTRLAGQTVDINADCGTIGGQTKVCETGTRLAGQTVDINADCGTIGGQTKVCPDNTRLAGKTVDINTDCGTIGGKTKVCPDNTRLAGQTVDINTDCGIITGKTKICPEGTQKAGQTVDINTDCGIITGGDDNDPCPAGQTRNPVTGLCEYTKFFCGEGYTLNILTGQCEKDDPEDDPKEGILNLPTPNLKVPGRGDFVTADDVLVKNLGDVGGIYSILPAPVREPFLADRRQQDIRNVADTVGIRQGQAFNQDPFAVERFARYANAFDIGVPELLDISGVLPSDLPLYEEKFGVQFPEVGIQPPVRPEGRIAKDRYDPTSFVPTAMADGGVVKQENGIESLLDRRQQAVNRMLAKRAGTYFGQ
jgi:hypothetical protein